MSRTAARDYKSYKNIANLSNDFSIESDDESDDDTLNLISHNLSVIPPVTALNKGPFVTTLILTNNNLKSLHSLKCFRNLVSLQLDRNNLNHIRDLPQLNQLQTLWLNNNRLSDFRSLLSILCERTPNLEYLSLLCNPLCPTLNKSVFIECDAEYHRSYRLNLIRYLPKLVFLDTLPVTFSERKESIEIEGFNTVPSASHVHKRRDNENNDRDKMITYEVSGELFRLYSYYKPIKVIATGAYGVVCSAIDRRNNKKVAIKKCNYIFDKITTAKNTLREIQLLSYFTRNKCTVDIIELYDCVSPAVDHVDSFENICIVMPYYETNLLDVIDSKQVLSHSHLQCITYQLLRGLKCIHKCGVTHGDIKPENILIDTALCKIKIIDFGASYRVQLGHGDDDDVDLVEHLCTRWYRAPELLMCDTHRSDQKIDIWSAGCVLAELILKKPLFPYENYSDQLLTINNVMDSFSEMILNKFNNNGDDNAFQHFECVDLLRRLLAKNAKHRLSAKGALYHPYFYTYSDDGHMNNKHLKSFEICNRSLYDMNTESDVRRVIKSELQKFHQVRWKKIIKKKHKKTHRLSKN